MQKLYMISLKGRRELWFLSEEVVVYALRRGDASLVSEKEGVKRRIQR